MKISYNWLKKYIDTDLSPIEISEILTNTGLEVEGVHKVESIKGGLEGIFVGEIISTKQHPNADRLKLTNVSIGNETLQIVCGANNARSGIKVIVATVGSTLWPTPEKPFKIKKSKIRGVESFGMLCAEDEIGIGTSHEGILELDKSVKVGIPASNYFDLEDDYQIEIGLTPNRSDAMGHIGVARDLIAYLNVHNKLDLSLNIPPLENFEVEKNNLNVDVSIQDKENCPHYMGVTISGVTIKSSPSWLKNSLKSIGISPINNVVDVTNYVMHELGSPLHVFDASKLNGKIVVKNAKNGDEFKTLDGVNRKLKDSNLMITNGIDNLCIAGVIGGEDSSVKDETTNIFLESAYFNPISIRKTAKMFGLNTDASFRFERGVDPNTVDYALKRAALLIQELAGGHVSMDVVDLNNNTFKNHVVVFNYERCNKLIGVNLSIQVVDDILENLGIKILSKNASEVKLEIPSYRIDVTREVDVIEEVLRIYGFNNIPILKKLNSSINKSIKLNLEKVQHVVSEMLVGMGFSEIINNSLTKSEYYDRFGNQIFNSDFNVEMLNPLSKDLDIMRQSLLFNLLETITYNQNRQNPNLMLYEYGKVYQKNQNNYSENNRLMICLTGLKGKESWNSLKENYTYYSIKGIVLSIFKRIGINTLVKEKEHSESLLYDGVSLFVLDNKIGDIGWVSPDMKDYFGLKNDVFIADLNWDQIIESIKFNKIKYTELPKTFAVRRDFSLLLNSSINFSEIENIAKKCDKKILKEVSLFDVYEGDNLDKGKKSYTVSFMFQDSERTLKDSQVDHIMDKIRIQLESKLNAQLR
ncbi:MAG: phenylalanine--tRNA ligase subunit beta [Crocinitomicaceae bacterium]|nr:phenylalanine--tRNA ligase subunit beta [Crocinitomicaceae bacterium]|tara:strand:+ start:110299 stop:112731 length:2433 start_codon:yes stop_codon:yes gene_type:complete